MGTINYGTSDYITIGYNCNMINYNDLDDETLKEIDAAIQDMRETVKSTPTWTTLPKSEKWA